MENPKKMPDGQITIKIGVNSYTIKMPNYGHFIDMERLKYKWTDGTRDQMLYGGNTAISTYVYTEALAAFTILVPEMKKDLTVNSLLELNPIQSKELIQVYTKQISPWLKSIIEISNEEVDEPK